jgi:adenine-specific DNA-methyltransferase
MARQKIGDPQRRIESYEHQDKQRVNNPPVGLVTLETDPDLGAKRAYSYDPHLDPQLVWAGKAEHTSFQVPTVSLHVHERIDPRTIIEAVRKLPDPGVPVQRSIFQSREENPPLRQAIEFYKHAHGWSNRLIAGDSLLVMNSLIEKEGMAGKVQTIYMDPPYGIKYGSNFQPFVNNREVKDGKDEDLTAEPEMIKAFRDTWELGIHSYLTYLRDRLLLACELLHESGSIFVQISDENVHHARELMDEVFGRKEFVSLIAFATTSGFQSSALARAGDYVLWYAKDGKKAKYRQLYAPAKREIGEGAYRWIQLPDGSTRSLTQKEISGKEEIPKGAKLYRPDNIISQGAASESQPFEFKGKTYKPPPNSHWKANYLEGMQRLAQAKRLHISQHTLQYIRFADDFPWQAINNMWQDTLTGQFTESKIYVVQTNTKIINRCLLMTTDPGDLVFDPTCGSGTTAYVAEQWGRRWVTCDTSRVAITLAKQRLMTAVYEYYDLAHPKEGVGSGFVYKTVPHITLKSIANNEPPAQESLYDQPLIDHKKTRVSGPFTVEAVPAPAVKSVDDILAPTPQEADVSVARSGETLRQSEWRDELLRTGIRGKAGQRIRFARLEPLPGCRWLHADGETLPNNEGADSVRESAPTYNPMRVAVSFGPEYAPLEQRQVEQAIDEAQTLVPRPRLIAFAAFQFDPEAAKDIDETQWPGVTLLKVQMNADLLIEDLKKKRASNESFWLIGQPDVTLRKIQRGEHIGKWEVEVYGFDYYNTKTGGIESGGADKIAIWLLDTDYDGRSLFPRQVFFPQASESEGWAKLARNLKAEIDEDLIEAYRGTVSLPFDLDEHSRVAVKIVDDRGVESLKVIDVK